MRVSPFGRGLLAAPAGGSESTAPRGLPSGGAHVAPGAGKEALMCLRLHSALLLLWKGNFVPDSKHCIWTVEKPRASPSGVRGAFGTNVKGMELTEVPAREALRVEDCTSFFLNTSAVPRLQELTAAHSIKGPNSLWHAFFFSQLQNFEL